MKKSYVLYALLLLASCTAPAGEEGDKTSGKKVYVINNGTWGDSNSDIAVYDLKGKSALAGQFSSVNGQVPGDLIQDALRLGESLYLSVNGSKLVWVTDESLKIIDSIIVKKDENKLSPRYLCTDGENVYVSYYEGFLGRLGADGQTSLCGVGPNPEGIAYLDGKVYVANSGGYLYPEYCNTVSVVDAASFSEIKRIEVNTNPAAVKVCGGKVFVSSFGNYSDIGPAVDCIEPGSDKVSRLPYQSPSAIATDGDELYVLCGGYDEQYNPLPGRIYHYDPEKGDRGLWNGGVEIDKAYSISCAADMVWVGSSDYKNNGDIYCFDKYGDLYDKFDSQGINPILVIE